MQSREIYLRRLKEVFRILKLRHKKNQLNLIEDFKKDSFWEKAGLNLPFIYIYESFLSYRPFLQENDFSFKNDYIRITINEKTEDIAILELI